MRVSGRHPLGVVRREVLGDPAAHREADQVGARHTEGVEDAQGVGPSSVPAYVGRPGGLAVERPVSRWS